MTKTRAIYADTVPALTRAVRDYNGHTLEMGDIRETYADPRGKFRADVPDTRAPIPDDFAPILPAPIPDDFAPILPGRTYTLAEILNG